MVAGSPAAMEPTVSGVRILRASGGRKERDNWANSALRVWTGLRDTDMNMTIRGMKLSGTGKRACPR